MSKNLDFKEKQACQNFTWGPGETCEHLLNNVCSFKVPPDYFNCKNPGGEDVKYICGKGGPLWPQVDAYPCNPIWESSSEPIVGKK